MPGALLPALHEGLVAALGLKAAIGRLGAGLGAALLIAGHAAAEEIPRCPTLPPVEDVAPSEAPKAVQFVMTRDIGRFALPGQAFDDHDEVVTGVSRRLIWIRRRDTRWVIAVEVGGKLAYEAVLAYEMGYDGSIIAIRSERAFPATICQVTERLLWR